MTCTAGDPMVEVILTWGDGEDETLTIGPDCPEEQGVWYVDLNYPLWADRLTSAPPSAWVPGDMLLAVVRDVGALALTVAAGAGSTAALEVQKAILEAALTAWPSTVTIRITDPGGAPVDAGPWEYHPTTPSWGPVTPADAAMYAAASAVSLTVNPPGSP